MRRRTCSDVPALIAIVIVGALLGGLGGMVWWAFFSGVAPPERWARAADAGRLAQRSTAGPKPNLDGTPPSNSRIAPRSRSKCQIP